MKRNRKTPAGLVLLSLPLSRLNSCWTTRLSDCLVRRHIEDYTAITTSQRWSEHKALINRCLNTRSFIWSLDREWKARENSFSSAKWNFIRAPRVLIFLSVPLSFREKYWLEFDYRTSYNVRCICSSFSPLSFVGRLTIGHSPTPSLRTCPFFIVIVDVHHLSTLARARERERRQPSFTSYLLRLVHHEYRG